MHDITLSELKQAAKRIAQHGLTTPLVPAIALSERLGKSVRYKPEYRQPTGSFKVRGALNAVMAQATAASALGVVTFSTGNHGRALAWAAKLVGAECRVFVSELTPAFKRAALTDAGATLIVAGDGQDAAEQAARDYASSSGALLVPPFDDRWVIAGQGTIMLEIIAAFPDVATVIVPVSGGGLAAGVVSAARALSPHVRIVGVSMERGAAMHASLAAGRPVTVTEQQTLADSLGGGVGGADSLTFPILRDGLDDLLLVDEEAIARGMVFAWRSEGLLLEGAAATPIALALDARAAALPAPIVMIATGCNVAAGVVDELERSMGSARESAEIAHIDPTDGMAKQ